MLIRGSKMTQSNPKQSTATSGCVGVNMRIETGSAVSAGGKEFVRRFPLAFEES